MKHEIAIKAAPKIMAHDVVIALPCLTVTGQYQFISRSLIGRVGNTRLAGVTENLIVLIVCSTVCFIVLGSPRLARRDRRIIIVHPEILPTTRHSPYWQDC
jgi:hypothetical protein